MITRRQFGASAPWLAGSALTMSGCSARTSADSYEAIAAAIRRPSALEGSDGPALSQELVRCATLAPSSHNTQCWKFTPEDQGITILPDLTRRCPAVDPDDHHVFVTLGCAAENLAHAALAHGLHAEGRFDTTRAAIHMALARTTARASPLFQAIPARQCTRGDYDDKPLSSQELDLLERAATSTGVRVLLLTERLAMERVLEAVVEGNAAQLADPAFVDELKSWVRFNGADAARTRDGLFSLCTGNPAIPAWLGELAFRWFLTAKGENDKVARQVRNSAGIAVFVGQAAENSNWVEVGRAYQRFALQATVLGIRNAFLNQPVEVAAVRSRLAAALGIAGQRPDLVVRFGRGPAMPQSLRRPVQAVFA